MKFKLTQLMAAAAVAVALPSQAMAAPLTTALGDIAYLNGTPLMLETSSKGSLAYSNGDRFDGQDVNWIAGAVGAMNLSRIKVRDLDGVGIDEPYIVDEFGDPHRTGITASLRLDEHTIDDTTGRILSVGSAGGIEYTGTRISGTLSGGMLTVTNLRFDLVNQRVYADLAGTKAASGTNPSVSYHMPNMVLWNIGNVSGPATIDPAALALTGQARIDALFASGFSHEGNDRFSGQTVLSDLQLTYEGFVFLQQSLGLQRTGYGGLSAVNGDDNGWGSVTLRLNFSVPAVPEPGSYALAVTGLLVVWGATRARRSRAA